MYGFELHWILIVWTLVVIGCVSNSAFAYLVGIPIIIAISAVRLKICSVTVGIKKYKSIIKKKKKRDKIVLLAKTKLHSIQVLL